MKKTFATLVLVCALLTAGAPAHAADSAAQYKTKVNAICKAGIAKLNAIPAPKAPADLKGFLAKGIVLTKELLGKIKAVTPPASLKPAVDKAFAAQSKATDLLVKLSDTLNKGGDPEASFTAAEPAITAATKAVDPLWRAAGLNDCAN